jgi:hypothetical protein
LVNGEVIFSRKAKIAARYSRFARVDLEIRAPVQFSLCPLERCLPRDPLTEDDNNGNVRTRT